MLLSKHIRNS